MRVVVFYLLVFFSLSGFGQDRPFITTWKTDNGVSSCTSCIMIPTSGTGYDYEVDWDMDGVYDEQGITGDVTHDFGTPGTYTIAIRGVFPSIRFDFNPEREKILSIDQWGDIAWQSFENAFADCINLDIEASDTPDLRAVEDMSYMFSRASSLTKGLENWDVSNVKNMSNLFALASSFDGDLTEWDVSSVEDMSFMFNEATSMMGSLKKWDTSSVVNMNALFRGASSFVGDISRWDVSSVTDMVRMFAGATLFNQDLSNWDVSSVRDMGSMFTAAISFNQDLSIWDVSSVRDMGAMFSNATSFNQDLSAWDVSSVINMTSMFFSATSFNQDLSTWDVSSVTLMTFMFSEAITFNQDLSIWDVSSVTDMSWMFNLATSFNQDLSTWDVSSVIEMINMFWEATSFNQDLSTWDVSSVRDMFGMFRGAMSFNQDLPTWDVSSVTEMSLMLDNCGINTQNYDSTLAGWAANPSTPDDLTLGSENLEYCDETGRDLLLAKGWVIEGDSKAAETDCLTATKDFSLENNPYLYPIPTHKEIHIANLKVRGNYKIYNRIGKAIGEGSYHPGKAIKIHHLPDGIFYLVVETEENRYPFVITKVN